MNENKEKRNDQINNFIKSQLQEIKKEIKKKTWNKDKLQKFLKENSNINLETSLQKEYFYLPEKYPIKFVPNIINNDDFNLMQKFDENHENTRKQNNIKKAIKISELCLNKPNTNERLNTIDDVNKKNKYYKEFLDILKKINTNNSNERKNFIEYAVNDGLFKISLKPCIENLKIDKNNFTKEKYNDMLKTLINREKEEYDLYLDSNGTYNYHYNLNFNKKYLLDLGKQVLIKYLNNIKNKMSTDNNKKDEYVYMKEILENILNTNIFNKKGNITYNFAATDEINENNINFKGYEYDDDLKNSLETLSKDGKITFKNLKYPDSCEITNRGEILKIVSDIYKETVEILNSLFTSDDFIDELLKRQPNEQ